MVRLTLSFLGTFQVNLGDKPITRFRSANVQGLLVYLVLHPGRAIARDVLATLFWPDEPDSVARTNFRQTLYQLRKLLERSAPGQPPFLIVTRQAVQFNPASNFQCDVIDFLKTFQQGDLVTAVGHPNGIYGGELLPGFTCDSLEFEDWLRRERQRLHGLALDGLYQRGDWLLSSGNVVEAKAMAQRQLTLEPWRELAHRQLMQAMALIGDRQAALTQFETCRDILWEELAVEPEPETIALAEQIAAGTQIELQRRPRHNLIAPVTPYFGRESDLTSVRTHVSNGDYRLVTLVGEGGIGKSRMALEVAWQLRDHFLDGVWFVPLTGITKDSGEGLANGTATAKSRTQAENIQNSIAMAVSQALDHPLAGPQTSRQQLQSFLQEKQLLLVLDNFEHLLDGADLVLDLLHHAPKLCVICTSREPLNFQAEWVFPLEKLPLPPIADPFLNTTAVPQDDTTYPAVQLFVDRAQRANGRFQLDAENQAQIVALCRLLSGLPLALELGAAVLRQQTLPQLIDAVQHSIDSLAIERRDIPPRHRSMRAVFESSWATLAPAEQAQLAGLSVFLGPFSIPSAAAVTGVTLRQLEALQEKSLLQVEGDRFVFHALLRQFAVEKLVAFSNHDEAIVRHSQYYLQAVAGLADALNGEMPHVAVQRIARAIENVRGAWRTAVARNDLDQLTRALGPLSDFFQIRGLYREGLRLFGTAAESLQAAKQVDVRAKLLAQQAAMHVRLAEYLQAIETIEKALPLTKVDWTAARLHITWGEALWRKSELAVAESKLNIALVAARKIEAKSLIGIATFHLGVVQNMKGEHVRSLAYLEEALGIWQVLGNLRWKGFTLNSIGAVARNLSRFDQAKLVLEEALQISQANNDQQAQTSTLNNLSILATTNGDFEEAKQFLLQALTLAEVAGDQNNRALLEYNLAWNANQAGWIDEAIHFTGLGLERSRRIGNRRRVSRCLQLLGDIAGEDGRFQEAIDHYQHALAIMEQVGDSFHAQEIRQTIAKLADSRKKKGVDENPHLV